MKLSRKVPLNALRVFEAVARHHGFSRAAEELGLSRVGLRSKLDRYGVHQPGKYDPAEEEED